LAIFLPVAEASAFGCTGRQKLCFVPTHTGIQLTFLKTISTMQNSIENQSSNLSAFQTAELAQDQLLTLKGGDGNSGGTHDIIDL